MQIEPEMKHMKLRSADESISGSNAGSYSQKSAPAIQEVPMTNMGDGQSLSAIRVDDVHDGGDVGGQVTGQSSVDATWHEGSAKCPLCLEDFVTQRLATPDTCDHTFCAVCLHEWSKKENKCPVDQTIFNCINIRHSRDGEIIMRIDVEPKQDSESDKKLPCCKYTLGQGVRPAIITSCMLILCFAAEALSTYFSHQSFL
jgi:hypothetical protein